MDGSTAILLGKINGCHWVLGMRGILLLLLVSYYQGQTPPSHDLHSPTETPPPVSLHRCLLIFLSQKPNLYQHLGELFHCLDSVQPHLVIIDTIAANVSVVLFGFRIRLSLSLESIIRNLV